MRQDTTVHKQADHLHMYVHYELPAEMWYQTLYIPSNVYTHYSFLYCENDQCIRYVASMGMHMLQDPEDSLRRSCTTYAVHCGRHRYIPYEQAKNHLCLFIISK